MFRTLIATAALMLGFQAHAALSPVELSALTSATVPTVTDIPLNVGDSTDYNLTGGIMQGTAHVFVRESTADGIWVEQDVNINLFGQQQQEKIEALYDKNTGKVLKLLANGQEQQIPDPSKMKVVETRQEDVTVPKGTFHCMFLKIHDEDKNTDTQTWITKDVPVGGMVKTISPSQIGDITLELTDFVKK